jgi:hypothetical protein
MIPNSPLTMVAALVGAATVAALVGCSSSGTPTPIGSGTTAAAQSASPSSQPAVTSPSSQRAVTSPAAQVPNPGFSGSAGGIDVTVAAQGSSTVWPGGPPMRFSITVVNPTTTSFAQVGMVVSMGHCSCSPPGTRLMPAGSMRMLDADTNAWVTVPYVSEGTGMDFIEKTLVPPFVLDHGQTITYQLQMQLDADQGFTVGKGESAIDVTMTNVTTNRAIGVSPTASMPIAVEPFGQ